ncbi:hypothetical protein EYC80_005601 [Monilinia laxa]|uniref:Uncharacterized protein n=1 Tax=Monilinia laxa TaxID=61186 RepID=A0A5N6KEH4_MONLA|nr:hypothetical protein EYC80_005601 [Monilinia laxa]
MSSSAAHLVSSSSSNMKASKSLPAGKDLKRTAESMGGGEKRPIKRVKPTKRDTVQIAPTKAQTTRQKIAPKSKPLLFTSDRFSNAHGDFSLQHLPDPSHACAPLPRLANGGCISREPEGSTINYLIQQRDREITTLKTELEESEMLRRKGAARQEMLLEQLRDTEKSLQEKLKSKAAKGNAYKQKCMDLEARFEHLSRRHYTLECNHRVVEENYQIAELNTKIFMDAYEMVKDREIQQASYVIFEGRNTPYFISHNYGGPKINTEELTTIQTAEEKEEIAEMEDYLNGITKECDIPVESIEEIPEFMRLTEDEIEVLIEEQIENPTKERRIFWFL